MTVKNRISQLLNRKKEQRITFTFITNSDGTVDSKMNCSKDIPVGFAVTALDRMKSHISLGMAERVNEKGYKKTTRSAASLLANKH